MKFVRSFAWVAVLTLAASSSQTPVHATDRSSFGNDYPVDVVGGGEESFFPKVPDIKITDDTKPCDGRKCDVIIVGAGLAGLSSAIFLTDQNKRVLVLEKEAHLGGLAAATTSGVKYDRGAAYWTDAFPEEKKILDRIHLGDYEKHEIIEPIDSYLWNGKLYPGIWDKSTMNDLPASFLLFHFELKQADAHSLIPNQPFEEADDLSLDSLNAREWIESMPSQVAGHIDELKTKTIPEIVAQIKRLKQSPKVSSSDPKKDTAKQIEKAEKALKEAEDALAEGLEAQTRYAAERNKLSGKTGMEEVIQLMDLYCRSALGSTSDQVSAVGFANFYISEIVPRFTTVLGTGIAAKNMEDDLNAAFDPKHKTERLATLQRKATVVKITNVGKNVVVTFMKDGKLHRVEAGHAVFAAQLMLAPKLIENFANDPKSRHQAEMMSALKYSHYSVHGVEVKGHPYRATYDTWTRASDYTENDFTDVILGRWVELKGYEGFRDFSKDPADDQGVLAIYNPLPSKWVTNNFSGYDEKAAKQIARDAVSRMNQIFSQLPNEIWKGPLDIKRVETSRWPFSVHVSQKGHFAPERIRELRRPYGHVYFANNNMGTPAFEEALFRGHCAANNILKDINKKFTFEKWSKCPDESKSSGPTPPGDDN